MRCALACLLLTVVCSHPATAQTCGGFERWAVKVGSDPAVSSINLTNRITTTLHDLVNLPDRRCQAATRHGTTSNARCAS